MHSQLHTIVQRPLIEAQIRSARAGRKRLVVCGRPGSGRLTAIERALIADRIQTFVADLGQVVSISGLHAAFGAAFAGASMSKALRGVERAGRRKRSAIVIRNVDGCSGLDDESAIVGALRTELQHLQGVSVFYTLADRGFLDRNFTSPKASFFKQAVILEVPDFTTIELDELAYASTGQFLDEGVRSAIVSGMGLKASDLARFFERLALLRVAAGRRAPAALSIDGVRDVLESLREEVIAHYSEWLPRVLLPRQRAVLAAFARGVPLRATQQMSLASGVPVSALSEIVSRLAQTGYVIQSGERCVFADPLLRLCLKGPSADPIRGGSPHTPSHHAIDDRLRSDFA